MAVRTTMTATAIAVGLLAASTRVAAQRWQLDVAGNSVGYDTAGRVTSASFSPLLEWDQRALYATVSGALAAFEAGQWTSQGHGDLSLLFAPVRSFRLMRAELVGSADGSVHSSGYRTAGTRGELRLHVAGRSSGVWIGATAATGWTSAAAGISTALGPTAGAWARRGAWNATAAWSPYRLRGAWYQQLEGRVTGSFGPVELTGYAGWRGAPASSGLGNAGWGGGTATVWVGRDVAVVVGGGSYASDLLQALPRGRYVSAGIRLSRHRPSVWAGSTAPRALYAAEGGAAALRFRVPKASRVAVVGDWTGWQAVALERAPDGMWVLEVRLPRGVHRFNLVVDGKRWIVPEEVAAVDDGFGGKIGLLVVP